MYLYVRWHLFMNTATPSAPDAQDNQEMRNDEYAIEVQKEIEGEEKNTNHNPK